jgi:hypothetical protein
VLRYQCLPFLQSFYRFHTIFICFGRLNEEHTEGMVVWTLDRNYVPPWSVSKDQRWLAAGLVWMLEGGSCNVTYSDYMRFQAPDWREFSRRAKQVIRTWRSWMDSCSEMLVHFHRQWDEMLDYRQRACQEIRELKATEQWSWIYFMLCFSIVTFCGFSPLTRGCPRPGGEATLGFPGADAP